MMVILVTCLIQGFVCLGWHAVVHEMWLFQVLLSNFLKPLETQFPVLNIVCVCFCMHAVKVASQLARENITPTQVSMGN